MGEFFNAIITLEEIYQKTRLELETGINSLKKVLTMIKFGEAGRTEEEVLSDLYNPDRRIRIKSAKEFTEGYCPEVLWW